MRDFFFHRPTSVEEALDILREHGEDARPMAGGTAIINLMKQSLLFADHIVSMQDIPGMRDFSFGNGELRIGALVTRQEVVTSPIVSEHAPLLSEVYRRVATVKVRNMATVGGGLAHADPAQDPPPALMILGARVRLVSERGERMLPVGDLFRDYYETAIEFDEILTELIVPESDHRANSVYLKFLPRTADDYATVGVTASVRLEDGRCDDVRVALNSVAPTPVRATAVEDALKGRTPSEGTLREASELVRQYLDPLDDFRGSAEYKRDMAVVFTYRALMQTAAPAQ